MQLSMQVSASPPGPGFSALVLYIGWGVDGGEARGLLGSHVNQ